MNLKFITRSIAGTLLLACLNIPATGQIRTNDGNLSMAGTSGVSEVVTAINSNVDLSSGVCTVNIPIFELKTNDMTIPIGFSYQTTGIRLTDLNNGPLGIGWNLTGGGKITRIIRGSSDIRWPLEFSKTVEQVWRDVENPYMPRNFESDLYYFETPTAVGMFILGADMRPVTIPYQNVAIEWHSINSEDGYFTIRDSNGNEYVLGETTSTREQTTLQTHYTARSDPEYTYTSTWLLDRVTSIKGEQVRYTYKTLPQYKYTSDLTMYHYQRTGNAAFKYWTQGTIRHDAKIASPKVLASIAWGTNAELEFSWSGNLLSSIRRTTASAPMYDGNEFISLSYLKNSNGSLLTEIKRNYSKTLYKFDYYNAKDYAYRKARDWWGFYNKVGDKTNLPANPVNELYAPDKSPNLEYARYHTLKQVVNSDGGIREFIYELNDGYTADNRYMQVGGLRIAALRTISGEGNVSTVCYEYKTPAGSSSGVVFANAIRDYYETYEPMYNRTTRNYADLPYNELFDVNQRCVLYSNVREIADRTITEYEFSTSRDDDACDLRSSIYHYHRDAAGQLIHSPQAILDNRRPFGEGNIDFFNTSRFWRQGLLKRKQVYDQDRSVILDQKYTYYFGDAPKQSVTNYQYYCNHVQASNGAYFRDTYVCAYNWLQEIVSQKSVETLQGPYNLYSKTEFTYDPHYLVPLREQTTDSEGNVSLTRVTYPFSYSYLPQTDGDTPVAALRWLKDNRIPVPVETVHTRNGNLLKAELNLYRRHPYMNYMLPDKTYELLPQSYGSAFSAYDGSVFDARYELKTDYCSYDGKGRLTGFRTDHQTQSVIYDDYSPAPLARISNAMYDASDSDLNQVFYNGFESDGEEPGYYGGHAKTGYRARKGVYSTTAYLMPGTYYLSYWKSADSGATWEQTRIRFQHAGGAYNFSAGSASEYIDEVRIHPVHAQMETFGYWPYLKKYTESDCNGKTTYYLYNPAGQLHRQLDDDYNITAEYENNTIIQ